MTVVEDARRLALVLHDPRLALALGVLVDPVGLPDAAARVELPQVRAELVDVRRDPLLVGLVREVGAEGAASDVGCVGVDAPTALAEDARVARRQPGQVAPEDLAGVAGVRELDEGT